MKVKLLSSTSNAELIAYIAAKTCYSERSPIDLIEDLVSDKKILKQLDHCIKSGHHSVLEHINFTFGIEGITRSCSHQLVRHRLCSYSQQSQRYVKYQLNKDAIQESLDQMSMVRLRGELEPLFELTDLTDNQVLNLARVAILYLDTVQSGMPAEVARQMLPNCTKTNIVMTVNLRNLMHICNMRLCKRAQSEIRSLVWLMSQAVVLEHPWMKSILVPNCKALGFCREVNPCEDEKKRREAIQIVELP